MGLLNEHLVAKHEGSTIEMRGVNHVLRGLIYKLFVDGTEVSEAQNFFKVPTERKLEAEVEIGGARRQIVVAVAQKMLHTEYTMTIDGAEVALERLV